MNKLNTGKRTQLLACLVEGNSIRATARMTGVAFNTVLKFVAEAGRACSIYQDEVFHNLPCKRLQCDEIWAPCYAKEKNVPADKKGRFGYGSVWTWTAIDADTKLVPCWYVGTRDANAAWHFMHDLRARLANRVQLTTDSHKAYLSAVDSAFGAEIDYAQLVKIYGPAPVGPETRYSPAVCMRTRTALMTGEPNPEFVSTSFVERANLTMRMGMRRFTRLTNGHSKKVENHEHAVALHFMHYNFCRIHQSLRVTPAMQAGITDHVWELHEIVSLMDCVATKAA
jgi:IS1 family transposase